MRPFAIFAIWLTTGLIVTGLIAGTLEQVVIPAGARDGNQATAYAPPSAAPSQFLANLQQRSDANR
jgi:hypothetical protein